MRVNLENLDSFGCRTVLFRVSIQGSWRLSTVAKEVLRDPYKSFRLV